ncbi:Cilia- and flagella-associated protein 91 [Gaertneriomyces sp. JEL0708]|nr:Cilia- and flagella-associated protein 91 [Gaertneriomyces sp. JEL0708]
MASQTVVRTKVTQNRPHDYLYDVNHSVAGRKDHVKAVVAAQTHDVLIRPSFENMFSVLPHHPQAQYAIRTHALPPDLGQDRRTYNVANPDVVGSNRFKYFRRPIIPYMPSIGTQIVYARRPPILVQQATTRPATPPTKTVAIQTMYRESEAQTDPYSPEYTIAAHLSAENPPELLAIATLTWGAGLPVGLAEVEMIERARAKRAWEATLPKVVDQESFERRLQMMEQMELQEWRDREQEIKNLQDARLEILAQVIEQREEENERLNNERVKKVWENKLKERDNLVERLKSKKVKALRKLADKRSKVEVKIERRDIIEEYADFGSRVYAPKTRDGVFFDRPQETLQVRFGDFEDYEALEELERDMLPRVLQSDMSIPALSSNSRNLSARKNRQMQAELALMDQRLKQRKAAEQLGQEEPPLRFAQKIPKPAVRPKTPVVVQSISEEEEAREIASILLQKLIRGRVVQNAMYQGKERRIHLINELRMRQAIHRASEEHIRTQTTERMTTRPLTAAQAQEIFDRLSRREDVGAPAVAAAAADIAGGEVVDRGGTMHEAVDTWLKREDAVRKERSVGASVNGGAGEDLEEEIVEEIVYPGSEIDNMPPPPPATLESYVDRHLISTHTVMTLDFLTKELTRLRQQRQISALVMLATRTRRMREAAESGRRQAELERRKREDEIFRQIVGVHSETVDTFLENIVQESIDKVSGERAKVEVRDYVEKLAGVVEKLENRDNGQEPGRTTVADLVASFLIPEVERRALHTQVKLDQRRYLQAAHNALYQTVPDVEAKATQASASSQNRPDTAEQSSTVRQQAPRSASLSSSSEGVEHSKSHLTAEVEIQPLDNDALVAEAGRTSESVHSDRKSSISRSGDGLGKASRPASRSEQSEA